MGSDLLKPYPARHQTTPAVIERPRPVLKGLRPNYQLEFYYRKNVERPRPVLKGLRPLATNGIAETAVVERPRPTPKGLRRI